MLFTLNSKLASHAKAYGSSSFNSRGNFDEVTKMVDDMVTLEGKEQADDDHQMPWCNGEFEKSDREEKSEKSEIESLESEIDQAKDAIDNINGEIATLKAEIME